jgi:hypothetical protein
MPIELLVATLGIAGWVITLKAGAEAASADWSSQDFPAALPWLLFSAAALSAAFAYVMTNPQVFQ